MTDDSLRMPDICICIQKPSMSHIIVSTAQVIQTSFFVIHVPAIPKGLDCTQRAGKGISLADRLTPSIVSIRYHFGAVAVNQANDIALQVVQVGVGSTIEDHHSRLVLRIIEEVQVVAAIRHEYKYEILL